MPKHLPDGLLARVQGQLREHPGGLALHELEACLTGIASRRSLQRWLKAWHRKGIVRAEGIRRGRRYFLPSPSTRLEPTLATPMAQCSPGVERVAAILNFMADHPDHAFTVSDLVRAVKISRSTCHTLVFSLVKVGYLYRASDKTYVLGPTLASVGQIAAKHASPLLIAQPEMRALADELDVICSAFFRDGDHLVVRERAASGSNLGWSAPKGARIKLRAPFAANFYAWSPPGEAAAWLDASTPPATAEQRVHMERAMAFVRERGFNFSVRNTRFSETRVESEKAFDEERTEFPVSLASHLDVTLQYPLISIVSPVFDQRKKVLFVLALVGFTHPVQGREVERMGQRLKDACARISSFISGPHP